MDPRHGRNGPKSSMTKPNEDFWRGKQVLITGNSGFKGSWLSIWLLSLGANVHGLALEPDTKPSIFNLTGLSDRLRHHEVDIRDFDGVSKVLRECRPEVVFHLAAQPLVRRSYLEPNFTFSTNLMGTLNLFEAVRKIDCVEAIVNVTTDKCYENNEWLWGYREHEKLGGDDPYSASKACAELLTQCYRKSFFQSSQVFVATARAGNVIGGGDWSSDRLVPDALRDLEKGNTIKIRNPNSVRPWQHVLEPLSGYITLAENLVLKGSKYAEPWNFGPHEADAQPVYKLVDLLCKKWGIESDWKLQDGAHPKEANFLKLDISKATNLLDWNPCWSLETAVEKIIAWHKGWKSGDCPFEMCLNQIEDYCFSDE